MMRSTVWMLCGVVLLAAGCMQVDENPNWNPMELPDWTYDAPWYYRPTEELQPKEKIGPENIPIYYTNQDSIPILHPDGQQANGVPRIEVWCSTDEGMNWEKVGAFGVEQTHFYYVPEEDGSYWIRFVGPGQPMPESAPVQPQRIYVVDRKSPEIALTVTPPPWEDEQKKVPHIYQAGQTIEITWSVRDSNIEQGTIRLGMAYARFPNSLVFMEIPESLPSSGTIRVEVPQEAVNHGGIRFRMVAEDKAGNTGLGISEVLLVRAPDSQMPADQSPEVARATEPSPTKALPESASPSGGSARTGEGVATVRAAPALPDKRPSELQESQEAATRPNTHRATQPAEYQPPPLKFVRVRRVGPTDAVAKKVKPFDLVRQTHGTPGPKLGWPSTGTLIRGGTFRRLNWLPSMAAHFDRIELQFSATDGRTWQTVAKNLRFGRVARWTVPMVTSKICRLRVVAVAENGDRVMLALSPKFTVDTVMPETTLGPKALPPDE